MRGFVEALGVLVSMAVAGIGPAAAADCQPLLTVATVQLVPGPTTGAKSGTEYVPVTLNGITKQMLLDTGASGSHISAGAAESLKLSRHRWRIETPGEGETAGEEVEADEFGVGTIQGSGVSFTVAGDPQPDPDKIGVLGADFLHHYDVDIDFPVHALKLFSQNHCAGKVVYWPASALAVVPFRATAHGRIVFPVTLDGHVLQAVLDTGSARTVLPESVAVNDLHLDLSPGAPGVVPFATDDLGPVVARHKFATLSFAGSDGGQVAIGNVEVRIVSDSLHAAMEEQNRTATRLRQTGEEESAPVNLGMNVLRHLHVYIAYGEQRLYISPGSEKP